jgi:hypothetical protein
MERYICLENIKQFQRQLAEPRSEPEKIILRELLANEQKKLAALPDDRRREVDRI